MAAFTRVLVAIDLGPASASLIQRVMQLYPESLDKIHVVHVIRGSMNSEAINKGGRQPGSDADLEANRAVHSVFQLLQDAGLASAFENFHLVHGEPSSQIKRVAKEIGADLVIVGSHSKNDDWMSLPGATTNCVIQGISSDVMAIKL